jgi:pimeloyl-ACP methyl ester carboxylesterase
MRMSEDAATVVLVHGAWHGPWVWDHVVESLSSDGIETVTVDLPSSGPDPGGLGDLRDDVAAVQGVLDDIDGPVVILAHSYGGAPVSEAAMGADGVVHIIYLTAFMLDVGESLLSLVGGEAPPWWDVDGDGSIGVHGPADVFYNDCRPEVAEAAVAQLHPQSWASVEQPLQQAAWHDVPTTYVVCQEDNAIPVEAQELLAKRAEDVRYLDSGHSPFLSVPDDLLSIIREKAGA